MVESIINESLMRQIEEVSQKRGISFNEACRILVEHGVSFTDAIDMMPRASQFKIH